MRRATRGLTILLGLVTFGTTRTASADDAQALLRHGVELRREGHDADALDVFSKAYEAEPSAHALAQIALAHQALGHWVEAEAALSSALSQSDDDWIAENREPLTAALAKVQSHLGWLEVVTNVENAELWINGVLAGTLPAASPARVVNGVAVVELRALGYDRVRRTVEIGPEARAHEMIPLVASPPPAVERDVSVERGGTPSVPSDRAIRDGGQAQHAWGWRAIAGGSVLVAGGAVAQFFRERNARIYNDDSRCFFGTESRDDRCGSYRTAVQTTEALALAGYISGGIAIGVGTVLLVTAPERPQAGRVECGPWGIGATCGSTF